VVYQRLKGGGRERGEKTSITRDGIEGTQGSREYRGRGNTDKNRKPSQHLAFHNTLRYLLLRVIWNAYVLRCTRVVEVPRLCDGRHGIVAVKIAQDARKGAYRRHTCGHTHTYIV
jgi:hypothetical protein